MGNLVAMPSLVGENIMSFLDVKEAEKLIKIHPQLEEFVNNNRSYWLKKAKFLNFTDPISFVRLQDPKIFEPNVLVQHTLQAYHAYREGLHRFYSKAAKETLIEIDDDQVESLAVCEKYGHIAVHLSYTGVQIYCISRFGDPPIKHIPKAAYFWEIVLHGDVYYTRPSPDEQCHARPFNWRTDEELPSLSPSISATKKFALKKSTQLILTYDIKNHKILAYKVNKNDVTSPCNSPC